MGVNAKGLHQEFAAQALAVGSVFLFDEEATLDLISRAQQEGLAVSGIEMVRRADADRCEPLRGRMLRDSERLASWGQARSFVEMLAGRGLYFQVVFESPWSTRLARLRFMMRTVSHDSTSFPPTP